MAKVICIANRKGGVGKTTTVHALVCGLIERGHNVLSVDVDGQRNLSKIMEADTEGLTVYDVLTGKTSAADAVQHTAQGDIIPAAAALEVADIEMDPEDITRLRSVLAPLLTSYDYIVIDTPPSAGILTINALTAADFLIIPARADMSSLDGMDQISELIETYKDENPNIKILGVLLTSYSPRAKVSRGMAGLLKEAAAEMNTQLFKSNIRQGIAVVEAQALRKSLLAVKSNVADDYRAWIDEVEKMLS